MPHDVEITEFTEIDPDELHFVARGANGFPALLAKADGDCPTCKGTGKIRAGHVTCPDCKGSGKDPDADAEKAATEYEALVKAKYSAADLKDMKHKGQAIENANGDPSYPIKDKEDLEKAIHAVGRGGADHDAIRLHVIKQAKALNLESLIPDTWNADGTLAAKAQGFPMVTGANPVMGGQVATSDAQVPGSPSWEASDADTAAQAAQQLMAAADLIRTFAGREGAEVAAGEGSDLIDEFDALCALDAVTCALGIMARLAFIEGNAAGKGADVEKAGKVLSSKSVDAIRAAVKALNDLLASAAGGSNPDDGGDSAEKGTEVLAMTKDELNALLDERDAASKTARKEAKEAANAAKVAKRAEKAEAAKKAAADREAAKSAADAEMSDEERAAKKAARDEKKATKAAAKEVKKAEKIQAAARAAAVEVGETVKSVEETLRSVADRLSTVEKMAAPGGPVKTRDPGALHKSEERDRLELAAADFERKADATTDSELRKGYLDKAKVVRTQIAGLAA